MVKSFEFLHSCPDTVKGVFPPGPVINLLVVLKKSWKASILGCLIQNKLAPSASFPRASHVWTIWQHAPFDTVDHVVLINQLKSLEVKGRVIVELQKDLDRQPSVICRMEIKCPDSLQHDTGDHLTIKVAFKEW
ncbi:hypothetical protein Y1Q_0000513 [Alligator mississippiensis]|uniref:Uncharacterized protein n=1 Tax=Alligator mississippiensis TaxID=8496 RepID=A0A151MBB8_ALLMI|nr:hypothetical protein Y1Q_0000513 [Alligator mississippiensis]